MAGAFLLAVLWTVVTTQEYPLKISKASAQLREHAGLGATLKEIAQAWSTMPKNMSRLGIVQLLTFLGLFCMWLYFGVAVAHNIFGATDPDSSIYRAGVEWGATLPRPTMPCASSSRSPCPPWSAKPDANTPTAFACYAEEPV